MIRLQRKMPEIETEINLLHEWVVGEPIIVPSFPADADLLPNYLYEVYVDPSERDAIFGAFIEYWDALEVQLAYIFRAFTNTETAVSRILISTYNGLKPLCDAIRSIGEGGLQPEVLHKLENLLDRVKRMATKRNFIIHGKWVINNRYQTIENSHGVVCKPISANWIRVYEPTSPIDRFRSKGEKKAQVESKFRFSVERFAKECQTISALIDDFVLFSDNHIKYVEDGDRWIVLT